MQGSSENEEKDFQAVRSQSQESNIKVSTSRRKTKHHHEKDSSLQRKCAPAKREASTHDEESESSSTFPFKKKKSSPNSSSKKIPSLHPRSHWQEPDREDGLTLYEWHRQPRPVLSGWIQRPMNALLQCFRCAICLETIYKAVVVECLHRFCEECIERALTVGTTSGQCPICRAPIPSRRKLSRDPAFDSLIEGIFGEARAFDKSLNNNPSLATTSLQKGISKKRTEQSKNTRQDSVGGLRDGLSLMIDFALLRHEPDCVEHQLGRLDLPYIRTPDTVTVQVIKKFLQQKLNLGPHLKIQLLFSVGDSRQPVVLDDALSLASIAATSSRYAEILELFYRREPKQTRKDGKDK